jgi:hypothetical protein
VEQWNTLKIQRTTAAWLKSPESGNTNVGGYVSGNTAGGYEGGARVQFRFK